MIQVLAVISAAASGGFRLGLPLLIIGLANVDKLWSEIPLLNRIQPEVLLAILVSVTIFEILGTKRMIGLRIIQIIQLILSPVVGAILAVGAANWTNLEYVPLWIIAVTGGLFALVLRFVLVGLFFRWGKMPIILTVSEDILAMILALLALTSPENGGLIAMLLLLLALRISSEWRQWQKQRKLPLENLTINPDSE
ncbi:hypothetical protein AA637_11915 [Cyanobacterium sp. HL-69]|uniref:DUF4126 domain-containing protein n=1 Tax=unclassified Cyanobacterium TaxID=2629879 RepID=UPI0008528289|nr:DUF4126 domain-containing protein [Cyanobacterium sp. IPPAS B-1200]AUC61809.1 hypothetical protein AA637_11915 [Cyanobacterium sp. HL-69]OEJ77814.1 hypothetical protein A5482_04640 [Cyanobacterium sp. IPPAS B-1200]